MPFAGAVRRFFVGSLAACLGGAPFSNAAHLEQDTAVLAPSTALQRTLQAGQAHSYRIELAEGRPWLLQVQQLGIDVVVEVMAPRASKPAAFNSPTDRWGPEWILLQSEETGDYRIEVRGLEPAGPSGRYEIRVDEAGGGQRRLQAVAAMSEAGGHYFHDTADSRRSAIAKYQQALSHWEALGEIRPQALALYCTAVLHRLLNESQQALELYRQALPLFQSLQDRFREADVLNALGLIHRSLGKIPEAQQFFSKANTIRLEIKDRHGQAPVLSNICLMSFVQGDLRQGLECYQDALELFRQVEAKETEAAALTNMGRAFNVLGQPEKSLGHYNQALELYRSQGKKMGEGQTLNNLAFLHESLGEPQQALSLYSRALEIFGQLGALRWQARALHNIGGAFRMIGELDRALSYQERALALRRDLKDLGGQANSLRGIGDIRLRLQEPRQAISLYQQALGLERATKDRRGEGITLRLLGHAQMEVGQADPAIEYLDQALEALRDVGDHPQQALALRSKGQLFAREGRLAPALDNLTQALEIFRAVRNQAGEAGALHEMARVQLAAGRTGEALEMVESAIRIIESLRSQVLSPDLRAAYMGTRRGAYELQIELLMQLHHGDPSKGYDKAALEAGERARARSLLDLLGEMGGEIHRGLPAPLVQRLRSARRRVQAGAERQQRILAAKHSQEQATEGERNLYEALSELDQVEAEIRKGSPDHAALTPASTLSADEIQKLLDEDTLFLEYALGESRSFLWAVTKESISSFELPGEDEIEAAARRVHSELSTPGTEGRETAALGRLLLGPVSQRLDGQRLVVVADGALHYLPFAALSSPRQSGPLLLQHEVVHLPSASTLALLRGQAARRSPAPKWAAVLADPVFEATDVRVRDSQATNSASNPRPSQSPLSRQADGLQLHRLSSSRLEAEAISALVSGDQVLKALDFEASRQTALGGQLSRYRIVHLATHGLIDSVNPSLSGLVLSLVDELGSRQDGWIRLHDIYNLELQADLVVLSACRTALGRKIRGEGFVGLTRGFMYAGASRVIASLWSVPDKATARLMSHLYTTMVRQGSRPAAALRSAQLHILKQRRWRHPYYWAGFVLSGDWK